MREFLKILFHSAQPMGACMLEGFWFLPHYMPLINHYCQMRTSVLTMKHVQALGLNRYLLATAAGTKDLKKNRSAISATKKYILHWLVIRQETFGQVESWAKHYFIRAEDA